MQFGRKFSKQIASIQKQYFRQCFGMWNDQKFNKTIASFNMIVQFECTFLLQSQILHKVECVKCNQANKNIFSSILTEHVLQWPKASYISHTFTHPALTAMAKRKLCNTGHKRLGGANEHQDLLWVYAENFGSLVSYSVDWFKSIFTDSKQKCSQSPKHKRTQRHILSVLQTKCFGSFTS